MAGKSGTFSDTGTQVNETNNIVTNHPGAPGLSIQGANAGGTAFVGIPNSSFDAVTGAVTFATVDSELIIGNGSAQLDNGSAGLTFDNTGLARITSLTASGIALDATFGGGTGPINLTSAGGINLTAQAYPTFAITAVDQGAKTFTIAGDKTALTGLQTSIVVAGSTGNDGSYTVASLTLVTGNTVVAVNEAISDATVDGTLTTATQLGIALTSIVPAILNSNPIVTSLSGLSSAIGGSALILGQQATTTVSITGASAAIADGAVVQVTPTGDVGDGFVWTGSLTAADTITVKVICVVAGTPASLTYNVKVF